MSAAPAPAYPVRYDDTQAGRSHNWIRGIIFAPRQPDFEGMREYLGSRRAARIINDEMSQEAQL